MMTPAQAHMHVLVLLTVGRLPTNTVGLPGSQGVTMLGTHGIGVKTPKAAAVAAMTCGFAGDEQMPNGTTLRKGLLSMTLATGVVDKTRLIGRTDSGVGAAPKLHLIVVPAGTARAISWNPFEGHCRTRSRPSDEAATSSDRFRCSSFCEARPSAAENGTTVRRQHLRSGAA